MTTDFARTEARRKLHARVMGSQNTKSGKWAVAIVGRREWRQRCGIGDGITAATMSLVTRCETREAAEALADELNDLEPGEMPGGASAWIFEAVPYVKTDYIGDQNIRRFQTRDVDRRIASL